MKVGFGREMGPFPFCSLSFSLTSFSVPKCLVNSEILPKTEKKWPFEHTLVWGGVGAEVLACPPKERHVVGILQVLCHLQRLTPRLRGSQINVLLSGLGDLLPPGPPRPPLSSNGEHLIPLKSTGTHFFLRNLLIQVIKMIK